MKTELARFAVLLAALVFGALAEAFLPRIHGVGATLPLALLLALADRHSLPAVLSFAIAAGATVDAFAPVPFASGVVFMLFTVAICRGAELGVATKVFAFPAYQLWAGILAQHAAGVVILACLISLPIGFVSLLAARLIVFSLKRRGGVEV